MKKAKHITAFSIILLAFQFSIGQSNDQQERTGFSTAIGMRVGSTSGITFKQFVSDKMAIEAIAGVWPYSLSLTGLAEFIAPAGAIGLNWYYGAGAHISFETRRIYYAMENSRNVNREGDLGLGIDGIAGIEYKINPIPIALSLDIKPFMEINTNGRAFIALDPGLGVKFAF